MARSNASVAEVKPCIKEMLDEVHAGQREPSPELERLQDQPNSNLNPRRRGVLDIGRLVDQPPLELPASAWTDIIEDSTLVSHLVSVFMI
jgi:hypothetical protein